MRHNVRPYAVLVWVVGCLCLLTSESTQAAQRYTIVLQHSQLQFKAYSLFAKPLGQFRAFAGEIVADSQQLSASHVRLSIDAASIDTDNAKRDKHLRSEDFLFVEKYPHITFVSTAISKDGSTYTVQGDLTLRGVTQRLTIPLTIEERPEALVVRGQVSLNRRDFGITYNAFFNPLQDQVDIMFTMVGVK